jgi:hypothetical protein
MALTRLREISYDEYQRRPDYYWWLQVRQKRMDLKVMQDGDLLMKFIGRPRAPSRKPRRGKLLFTIGARPTTS